MDNIKKTICDLLIDRHQKTPLNNAIGTIENKKISFINFQQYKETIESISIGLVNLGVRQQSKVCILSHTRKEWHFTDMAIMCSGAITVPIYPSYTAEEAEYIINHSDAEFLIIENLEQFKKFLSIQKKALRIKKVICFEGIKSEEVKKLASRIGFISLNECISIGINESQQNPDQFHLNIQNISPDSLATIVYTSGTTGKAKGAIIKHQALFQVLSNLKKYTHSAVHKEDRLLTYLPLSHVLGRLESFFPILFGLEAVYAQDMKKLLLDIPLAKPTLLLAVPRVLEKIHEKAMKSINASEIKKNIFSLAMSAANNFYDSVERDKTPTTSTIIQYQLAKKLVFDNIFQMFGGRVRYFISGGAPLSTEVIKFMRNVNLTVLEGYGLTETIAPCIINPLNKQVPGSVGRPIGDVEIKFLEDGEILLRSQAMFSGYYKDEAATKKSLDLDGWLHTGDIGAFDNSGFLKITDRKKDIIITSGGKNVAPQKIESQLKLAPCISHALIIGDKKKFLTVLIAIERESIESYFKEFEISDEPSLEDLANHPKINALIEEEITQVNQSLASFEKIKKFKIIPEEITTENYLTPSLKIKKKLLAKNYKLLIDAMYK